MAEASNDISRPGQKSTVQPNRRMRRLDTQTLLGLDFHAMSSFLVPGKRTDALSPLNGISKIFCDAYQLHEAALLVGTMPSPRTHAAQLIIHGGDKLLRHAYSKRPCMCVKTQLTLTILSIQQIAHAIKWRRLYTMSVSVDTSIVFLTEYQQPN